MPGDCPNEECQCEGWPPEECPQCGQRVLGFTPEDWRQHYAQECRPLGKLYCFVSHDQESRYYE